jgi:two-component system chemotaxis sensor kinase CheA
VSRVTAADDQLRRRLRSLFAEELQDGLHLLSAGLLAWEAGVGADADVELVPELFRAAHSLKGAAHAAGFPGAVAVCDRLETAFAAVRDGELSVDASLVTRLLGETDALTALAAELSEPPPPPSSDLQPALAPPADRPLSQAVARAGVGTTDRTGAALRITVDKVDALFQHSSEGLVASQRLTSVVSQAARAGEQVDAARAHLRAARGTTSGPEVADLEQLLDEAARAVAVVARSVEAAERSCVRSSSAVADAVRRLRTQPFGDACTGLERVVRDVATSGGKSAQLRVVGGELDVDRSIVAALRDPLLHLVRNAVDHGIEPAQARREAGKPPAGTVEIVAELNGSLLTVTVRDDGGGIDTQRLREVAASRGLAVPAEDDELPFLTGLSSRTDVTTVSGRGVGLDAARVRLEQLGGALEVGTRPGRGTAVTLTSPVTLALLRVLLTKATGHVVAVPTSSVQRVEHVERQALREVEGSVLLALGEASVRVVSLAEAMGLTGSPADDDEHLAVLVPRGGDAVLVADAVLDEVEIAVQPVPARLAGAAGVLGVALLDSGVPALVVNPVALGRHRGRFSLTPISPPRAAAARILLAEDTVTTRALERSILEAAGYSVAVAVDGADAWQQLQADGADLVVSDVDMPRMTGLELCRRIRSSAEHREVAGVLVTSLDDQADRQGGLAAGADAYVVKAEFSQGTLLDTIARLL